MLERAGDSVGFCERGFKGCRAAVFEEGGEIVTAGIMCVLAVYFGLNGAAAM